VKCQMPLPFCLPMHLDGLSAGQPGAYFIFLYLVITRWRLCLSASALWLMPQTAHTQYSMESNRGQGYEYEISGRSAQVFGPRFTHIIHVHCSGKINTKSRRKNLQPFFSLGTINPPFWPNPPYRQCKFNASLHTFAFRQPCVARSFSANRITIKTRKRWTDFLWELKNSQCPLNGLNYRI